MRFSPAGGTGAGRMETSLRRRRAVRFEIWLNWARCAGDEALITLNIGEESSSSSEEESSASSAVC